ncbi:MAG: hypothetical protein ACHQ6U_08615 [Thermodesulfobacteriota bacterium]
MKRIDGKNRMGFRLVDARKTPSPSSACSRPRRVWVLNDRETQVTVGG